MPKPAVILIALLAFCTPIAYVLYSQVQLANQGVPAGTLHYFYSPG